MHKSTCSNDPKKNAQIMQTMQNMHSMQNMQNQTYLNEQNNIDLPLLMSGICDHWMWLW